jgi:hypothetical protein
MVSGKPMIHKAKTVYSAGSKPIVNCLLSKIKSRRQLYKAGLEVES